MTLRLNGSTSGYIEITAPAVAGNNTVTLPSGNGAADQLLKNGATAGSLEFASNVVVDSSGRLLVGTSTVVGSGDSIQSDTSIAGFRASTAAGSSPLLKLLRSRGSTFSLSDAVLNNDSVGRIVFQAVDGSSLISAAQIGAEVDGTPGANDMPGRLVFATTADGAASPTERMRITSTGRLCVNTTSALATVNIIAPFGLAPLILGVATNGDSGINFKNASAVTVGSVVVNASSTAYNTSSDYRLKENVAPLTGAIDRLQQIPVHRFNFIANPGKTVDGFIAHEAAEVVPEAVTGTKDAVDEDGTPVYQGIDQSKLVPLLTAALQEAIGKIDALESRLAALEVN